MFEGARAAGAEQGTYEDMEEEEEEGGRFRAFSGSARTLAGGAGAKNRRRLCNSSLLAVVWGRC